ncbi:zf-CCHC domain-containing protein [Tanacetum coccineum]
MRSDELYKFSDGTLTRLRTSLEDIIKNIQMEYLPQRRLSSLEKKRAHFMIKAINKQLKERRMMRSLEKFVGGRHYRTNLLLLQLILCSSILMDSKVNPTKHGRMTKPYLSPNFIANYFIPDSYKDGDGVHFWAPTFKWGISIANIADFAKPPEKLSYPQQFGTVAIPLPASGSAQPLSKDDHQSSKKPRESDASASKQHPALTSTGWQITDTRDEWEADVGGQMNHFDKDDNAGDDNEETKPDPEEIYNSGPAPSLMTPGYISSGLVQISVSPTPYVPPSKKDYEILAVDPVGSPSSTTNDQDEQSTSTSPTNQEIQSQVTHQGPVPQFMAPVQSSSGPVLHEMMSDHNSSVLAPQRQIDVLLKFMEEQKCMKIRLEIRNKARLVAKVLCSGRGMMKKSLLQLLALEAVQILCHAAHKSFPILSDGRENAISYGPLKERCLPFSAEGTLINPPEESLPSKE